jgi:hypothetical protein
LAWCSRFHTPSIVLGTVLLQPHRSFVQVAVLNGMFTVQTAHTATELQGIHRCRTALLTRMFSHGLICHHCRTALLTRMFSHGLYLYHCRTALVCNPTIWMVRRLDYTAVGAASGAGGSPFCALRTRRRHALLLRAQHGDWRTHRCEAGGAGHPTDPVGDSLLRWHVHTVVTHSCDGS